MADFTHSLEVPQNKFFFLPLSMGAETKEKMPLVTAANLAQSLSREEPCLWLHPPPYHVSALAPAQCDKQLLS